MADPTPAERRADTPAAGAAMDRQIGQMAVEDQERASQAYPEGAQPTKRYRDEPIRHNRRP